MAPRQEKRGVRKVKQTAARKETVAGPAQADPPRPPRMTQALLTPSVFASEEGVAGARKVLVAEFIGGDQLKIRSDASPQQDGEVVTFHDFCVMGLLPPFYDFFMVVLEAFGLHMLHLHPNAVLILAAFTHAYEAFVDVMPSMALFRHFFTPRRGGDRDG